MVFEKDGKKFSVTDRAHIDCFIAKGWKEIKEPEKNDKTEKKTTKK